MAIDTTTPKYRRWHTAHVAWLIDNQGLDLIAARETAHAILQAGMEITGLMDSAEAQDSYDRLRDEHQITDGDMHAWANPSQAGRHGGRL